MNRKMCLQTQSISSKFEGNHLSHTKHLLKNQKLVIKEVLSKEIRDGRIYFYIDTGSDKIWAEYYKLIQENSNFKKQIQIFEQREQEKRRIQEEGLKQKQFNHMKQTGEEIFQQTVNERKRRFIQDDLSGKKPKNEPNQVEFTETQEWIDLLDFIKSQQPKRNDIISEENQDISNNIIDRNQENNSRNTNITNMSLDNPFIPSINRNINKTEPKSNGNQNKTEKTFLTRDIFTNIYYNIPYRYIYPSYYQLKDDHFDYCGKFIKGLCIYKECKNLHIKQEFWKISDQYINDEKTIKPKVCFHDEVVFHIIPKHMFKVSSKEIFNFYENYQISIKENSQNYYIEFESYQKAEIASREFYGKLLGNIVVKPKTYLSKLMDYGK